ncbi:MAG: hypothetical protein Kow0032_16720 [Methyloligellaceae bacterium]
MSLWRAGGAAGLALCFLLLPLLAQAQAQPRSCSSWRALYAASGEDGGRVRVAFARALSSAPHPLHITAHSADGTLAWRHTGHYWCYQGSGGCYAGLTYADAKLTDDEAANRLRIVFVNPREARRGREEAADILVIAGLNSAFFYGAGPQGLVFDPAPAGGRAAFAPEIFHFERCQEDGQRPPP